MILGNHAIDEIILGVAEDFDGNILYVLDQLSSGSIEISADSTDVTDKNGNVIRSIFTSKTGTFNSTNALLHPAAMNAGSGSEMEVGAIKNVPFISIVKAGASIDVSNAAEGTIQVIGLYGNGANGAALDAEAITAATVGDNLTVPASGEGLPDMYVVKYDRDVADGIKLKNTATDFADTIHLTLYCSYVDPCDDQLKACYVYLPSVQPDPNMTINLDRESTELDYNAIIQVDYCSADKLLYAIYYPGEDAVKTAVSA